MAETDQAILIELQKLNRTVSQGGSMGAGSELKGGSADPDPTAKAEQLNKQEEKFQKQIQTRVSKSTNKYIAQQAASLTTMKAIRELSEKNAKKDLKQAEQTQKAFKAGNIDRDRARKQMKEAGFAARDLNRPMSELKAEMDELTATVGDLDGQMAAQERTSSKASRALATLGAVAAAVGKQIYDVAEASMRTGVEASFSQAYNARLMGMSQVELIETQAQYRQVIESTGQTNEQFAEMMQKSSLSLITLTGSLKQGAIFAAETALQFRQLGASGATLAQFQEAQTKSFSLLHNTLSMTNDEFIAMNKQLMESQTTRVQLFKMSKQERTQYAIGLTQTMAYLKVQGLQTEQAHKVVEAMQGIAGMDPKSRLKKAAQIQAMAGAMGMGAEGEELARLTRSGAQDPGSIQRMTELSQQINAVVQQRQAGGLGSEMAASAILNATGTGDIFGAEGAMADLTLGEALAADPNSKTTAENTTAIKEWMGKLFAVSQGLMAFFSEGWISSILSALGISTLIGAFGSGGIMSSIWGGITAVGSGIATGFTSLLAGITSLGTTILGGLTTFAKSAATGAVNVVKGLGPRLASLAKFARVAAAPAAAAAAAAYGVQQAYQAITTGESDVNNLLNSTETGMKIGDAIGSSIAHTLAFFGNEQAQESIEINRRLEEQNNQANELAIQSLAAQTETNALQRKQIATTEQQTEAVVGGTRDAAQAANANQRSMYIRSAGQRSN